MNEIEKNEAARFSAYIEFGRYSKLTNTLDVEEAFIEGWEAKRRAELISGFWREWRGSSDGKVTMLIRTLFTWRGYRIDMHKFIGPDEPTCFHTHPARALRIILWGGYTEELMHEIWPKQRWRKRRPGYVGFILPETCHRISSLINGKSSYSIWLRWPKKAEIEIFGGC